jgi:LmbE family N-acetylglucosaminyl deacetylase
MNARDAQRTGAPATLSKDSVIVRRPHFRLRGDSLYFLISERPFATLSQAEQLLWNLLEKEASVAAIEERLGPAAEEGIRRLVALEAAEPILPPPAGKRRRVMVVEPHMDDAALSVGGVMLQRRAECEFLLVTMATRSLATSYRALDREFFDIETVSGLRKAESELVARLVWGRHIALGLVEATLRYHPQNWTLDWYRRHKHAIYVCLEHVAGEDELRRWTATLANAIAELEPEEIWMPLGVGMHADHQLTRHACLNVLRANPKLAERCVCRVFQDVPYAGDYRAHTAALVKTLGDAGVRLEEERIDITAVMPAKRRLLSIYASQWKTAVIQRRVDACAKGLGGPPDTYRELWYRVAAAPAEDVDMAATSAVKDSIDAAAREVAPWLRRHKSAERVGLLLAEPMGRWADDLRFLLDCFPRAHFEVHVQTKFAAEAEFFSSPRVSVRAGGNRWAWVLGEALPAIVGGTLPLVIISGREREKHGRWLARLGLFSDPVFAPAMSDFILALQRAAKTGCPGADDSRLPVRTSATTDA